MPKHHFKAFISYSRYDANLAVWLQNALESYKIDRDLIGRHTKLGPIPKVVGHVFMDRSDLPASPELDSRLRAELARSEFLVVICSPTAAKSPHVNNEIEWFREQGGGQRILAVIADGIPGDTELECFPESLKATGVTPLAADARPDVGEGRDLALQKLVSGMLAIPLYQLSRRAKNRYRRERLVLCSVVGALVILTGAVGILAANWRNELKHKEALLDSSLVRTSQLIDEAAAAADDYLVPHHITGKILRHADRMITDMSRPGVQSRKVLLKRVEVLIRTAEYYGRIQDPKKQRELGEMALKVLDSQPGDAKLTHSFLRLLAQAHLVLADALKSSQTVVSVAKYDLAVASISKGLEAVEKLKGRYAERGKEDGQLDPKNFVIEVRLLLLHSLIEQRRGDRVKAFELAQRGVELGESLMKDSTDPSVWRQIVAGRYLAADLIRQLNRRDLERQAGLHIDKGLQIARQLVSDEQRAPGRRRLLADLYLARGDFERWRVKHDDALVSYKEFRAIRKRLSEHDPENKSLRHYYAFALLKSAEQQAMLKMHRDAIEDFEQARKIYDELTRDNDSIFWWRWRWTAYQGLVYAHMALDSFTQASALCDQLIEIARKNRDHQNGQSTDSANLIETFLMCGKSLRNDERALDTFYAGLAEYDAHASKFPDDALRSYRLRRLKASLYDAKARYFQARDRRERALESANKALAIWRDDIAKHKLDPSPKVSAASTIALIAVLHDQMNNTDLARANFEDAVKIMRSVVARPRSPQDWLDKLKTIEAKQTAFMASLTSAPSKPTAQHSGTSR